MAILKKPPTSGNPLGADIRYLKFLPNSDVGHYILPTMETATLVSTTYYVGSALIPFVITRAPTLARYCPLWVAPL
ncbi:hypothetical protein LguiA_003121 [Lonicera macranthoides]